MHNSEIIRNEGSWKMFNRISKTYDRLNRILSAGTDVRWRKRLARSVNLRSVDTYLDLATGTGDQLFAVCKELYDIKKPVGTDMSSGMLDIANQKKKRKKISADFLLGDAMKIDLPDSSVDLITMSFGIRNVTSPAQVLSEISRVLSLRGEVRILEFGLPTNRLIRSGYLTYFRHLLPRIGGLISGDREAYRYLNRTSESFPDGEDFCSMMKEAGLSNVSFRSLSTGVAYLYAGSKA